MQRERQVNVRLSSAELERLRAVARHMELSVSATIRLLVRLEMARLDEPAELHVLPGHIGLIDGERHG